MSRETLRPTERCRVIEGLREKSGAVFVQSPHEANYEDEEDDHHDCHASGHHIVDPRRSLDAAQFIAVKNTAKTTAST